jgi:hypothetical protein
MLMVFFLISGCTDNAPPQHAEVSEESVQRHPTTGEEIKIRTHEERMAEVKEIVKGITVGMTREEVEKIFKVKDGGLQDSSTQRYYEHPEIKITVPYDQEGGPRSKHNRVSGPVKVQRGYMTYD